MRALALAGGFVALDVKQMSWWDTLRLHVFVALPAILWGLVAPNRVLVSWLSRRDAGRATAGFLDDLRQRYQCEHLWSWFPWRRTLLVLDRSSMDAVLVSEENAADPSLKKDALSKSIPDALTISSGNEWRDRRRFNERVLGFGGLHPFHDAFKEIVFSEVDRLTATPPPELRWADFQTLGERISHQVLLGSGRVEPEMTRQLAQMVTRSNWPFLPRHRRCFSGFYEQVERNLGQSVAPRCLLHHSAKLLEEGSATASTRVPGQIGFWFFVLKDAVELHVARTLALIAAHSEVQDRVRLEIRNAATLTGQAIDGLQYLDACVGEQLRLWTPVPILLRRAVNSFSLRGEIAIESGQQILIHTGFYHRDPRVFGEKAHRFSPGSTGDASQPVYFFSRFRQSCAGEFLARFLLKTTLAKLLDKFRFELIGPSIGSAEVPYSYDHFKIRLRPHGEGLR
jgi:cytochrome P450